MQASIGLYKYLAGRAGGNWEEVSTNATPTLYDANEDSNNKAPEWHLEVEGAQVRRASRGAAAGALGWQSSRDAAQQQQQSRLLLCYCCCWTDTAAAVAGGSIPHNCTLITTLTLPLLPSLPCLPNNDPFLTEQDPIDSLVDDNFSFEARDLRVTFFAGENDVWALKFGGPAPFERFLQKYNKAAFENRFGQEQTDASEVKVGAAAVLRAWGADGRLWWWVLVGAWGGWVLGGWPAERQQHMLLLLLLLLLLCQADSLPAWSSSASQAGRAYSPHPALPPMLCCPPCLPACLPAAARRLCHQHEPGGERRVAQGLGRGHGHRRARPAGAAPAALGHAALRAGVHAVC